MAFRIGTALAIKLNHDDSLASISLNLLIDHCARLSGPPSPKDLGSTRTDTVDLNFEKEPPKRS